MSNRSFINRAAEERRQRLVVGRVVARNRVVRLVVRRELIEHSVHRLVGIGGLALALHGVEIGHVGRVGLFIVAEQTHRISRLPGSSYLTRFLHANRYPLRLKTLSLPIRRPSAPERNGPASPAHWQPPRPRSRHH